MDDDVRRLQYTACSYNALTRYIEEHVWPNMDKDAREKAVETIKAYFEEEVGKAGLK